VTALTAFSVSLPAACGPELVPAPESSSQAGQDRHAPAGLALFPCLVNALLGALEWSAGQACEPPSAGQAAAGGMEEASEARKERAHSDDEDPCSMNPSADHFLAAVLTPVAQPLVAPACARQTGAQPDSVIESRQAGTDPWSEQFAPGGQAPVMNQVFAPPAEGLSQEQASPGTLEMDEDDPVEARLACATTSAPAPGAAPEIWPTAAPTTEPEAARRQTAGPRRAEAPANNGEAVPKPLAPPLLAFSMRLKPLESAGAGEPDGRAATAGRRSTESNWREPEPGSQTMTEPAPLLRAAAETRLVGGGWAATALQAEDSRTFNLQPGRKTPAAAPEPASPDTAPKQHLAPVGSAPKAVASLEAAPDPRERFHASMQARETLQPPAMPGPSVVAQNTALEPHPLAADPRQPAAATGSHLDAQPAAALQRSRIHAPAARDFAIQIPAAREQQVQLRVAESGGHVRVAVRTSDAELGSSLRSELGNLVERLETAGYRTEEISAPANTACEFRAERPEPGSWRAEDQRNHSGHGQAPMQEGGERRRRQHPAAVWAEQMARSLTPETMTQEEERS